jgi:repressor LexA
MAPKRKVSAATVAAALQAYVAKHGNQPTIEELRAELDVGSTRTVLRYLQELEDAGIIERWAGARGIRFVRQPQEANFVAEVPIVGEAPAGPLLIAEENHLGSVRIARDRRPSGPLFLLRVRGDSMNRASVSGRVIENGDLVLVRQTSNGETNDIVVALIDGQATIKRLKRGPHYIVLRPESHNPDHSPFVIEGDLEIQGVVIDVLKGGEDAIFGD